MVVFLGLLTAPAGFAYQLMIPFNIPQAPKYINSLGAADYDWMGRFKKGQDLAQQGHPADALSEYVWCFEDGGLISSHSARLNALLTKVIELGRTYPPAVRELQDWQLKASEKVRLNNNDLYNLYMLARIFREKCIAYLVTPWLSRRCKQSNKTTRCRKTHRKKSVSQVQNGGKWKGVLMEGKSAVTAVYY